MMKRPEGLDDDHLEYLDDLKEEGLYNMYEAPSIMVVDWGISRSKAKEYVKYWMQTFGKEDR